MTHSILDGILPIINITLNVKWVSVEGKQKAKLQKNMDLYIVYYMQVELRHDK